MTGMSRIAWRGAARCPLLPQPRKAAAPHCRSFFASSTDHTRLLADAQVHRLADQKDSNLQQYVLVAAGMDLATVQKVPQLHLARLSSDGHQYMWGAKVVTRTLGEPAQVCARLVEAARQDGLLQAKSTLHGLSDHVLAQASNGPTGVHNWEALQAMAQGKEVTYDDEMRESWEVFAREFVESGQCLEANLYRDHGGKLTEILHHEDSSEFADTCAGAMAVFSFD